MGMFHLKVTILLNNEPVCRQSKDFNGDENANKVDCRSFQGYNTQSVVNIKP